MSEIEWEPMADAAQPLHAQLVQTLRIPLVPSKLKAGELVASRPAKLAWDRSRQCLIRASLESANASCLLGDALQPLSEDRSAGLFGRYHAKLPPPNSHTGLYAADRYQCGPLKFRWNRGMLIMEASFPNPQLLDNVQSLTILFQA
jgi:hypothetical protein